MAGPFRLRFLNSQAQRRDDLVARHQADSMLQKINAELHRMKEIEEIRRDREQQYRERYEGEQVPISQKSLITRIQNSFQGTTDGGQSTRGTPAQHSPRHRHQTWPLEPGVLWQHALQVQ